MALQCPRRTPQPARGLVSRLPLDVAKDDRIAVTLRQASTQPQFPGGHLDGGIAPGKPGFRQGLPSPTACCVGQGVGNVPILAVIRTCLLDRLDCNGYPFTIPVG